MREGFCTHDTVNVTRSDNGEFYSLGEKLGAEIDREVDTDLSHTADELVGIVHSALEDDARKLFLNVENSRSARLPEGMGEYGKSARLVNAVGDPHLAGISLAVLLGHVSGNLFDIFVSLGAAFCLVLAVERGNARLTADVNGVDHTAGEVDLLAGDVGDSELDSLESLVHFKTGIVAVVVG